MSFSITNATVDWLDFPYLYGSLSGAALSVDASDPNAAAPDDKRVAMVTKAVDGKARQFLVYSDQACTVEGWVYVKGVGKWVRLFSQAIAAAYQAVAVSGVNVPDQVPFFLRLSVSAASAKIIGAAWI